MRYQKEWSEDGKKCYLSHRVRAERALGKPLPAKAIVHHVDGTMRVDSPLVICQDQAYHLLLHVRQRVLQAGGDPNTERLCYTCRQVKPFAAFYQCRTKYLRWVCQHCTTHPKRTDHWKAMQLARAYTKRAVLLMKVGWPQSV